MTIDQGREDGNEPESKEPREFKFPLKGVICG